MGPPGGIDPMTHYTMSRYSSTDLNPRARCSSMVEHPLMVRWVVGSILRGGHIELLIVPASVP